MCSVPDDVPASTIMQNVQRVQKEREGKSMRVWSYGTCCKGGGRGKGGDKHGVADKIHDEEDKHGEGYEHGGDEGDKHGRE